MLIIHDEHGFTVWKNGEWSYFFNDWDRTD
jgi:hypothetical protein